MNRRELIGAAGAVAIVAAASGAFAEDGSADHVQGDMAMQMPMPAMSQKLIDAAFGCVKAGQACLNHSLSSFATGDTMLATCARLTDQMIVGCETLAKLASVGSAHLHEAVRLATALCQDCEEECRKHAEHHALCKACGEACATTIEECKKITM